MLWRVSLLKMTGSMIGQTCKRHMLQAIVTLRSTNSFADNAGLCASPWTAAELVPSVQKLIEIKDGRGHWAPYGCTVHPCKGYDYAP
jgi:hypothetical protein